MSSSSQAGAAASLHGKRPASRRAAWLWAAAGSTALLGGLGWFVDGRELKERLATAELPLLGMAALVFAATLFLRGLRFNVLLRSLTSAPPRRAGYELASLNNLANHLLPFRLGELVFLFLATFGYRVPSESAVVTLVTARLYDLLTLALLVALHAPFLEQAATVHVYAALALLVVGVLALLLWPELLLRVARLGAGLLRRLAPKKAARLDAVVTRLGPSVGVLRRAGLVAANVVLGLALWSSLNLFFWLVLAGLGFSLSWPQVVLGAAATGLSALLPINTVGSIGTLEAGWVLGFVWVGLPARHAVSSSLVMHVIVIAVSALVALPHALRLGRPTLANFVEWQRHARGH